VTTFTHIIVMLFDRGKEGEEYMRGITDYSVTDYWLFYYWLVSPTLLTLTK